MKVGDIVQAKIGGPKMMVSNAKPFWSKKWVECQWWYTETSTYMNTEVKHEGWRQWEFHIDALNIL